uniref:CBM49 domain-containing protein n=1 Tax=Caenorhabditis tropicalis TaxID=1561998 RepID=A0A1I7TLQ3_9PELO
MIILGFLSLLAVLAYGNNVAPDCTGQNPCYGFPSNCHPNTDCDVIFQFDKQNNLDVTVHNVTEDSRYFAIEVRNIADLVTEYLICVPRLKYRARGFARPGERIHITEPYMAQYVNELPNDSFVCTFLRSELPAEFLLTNDYVVSTGEYSEDMVVSQGNKLSSLNADFVFIHNIAASVSQQDAVITPDESKLTSDLLGKMTRISSTGGNDLDLESLFEQAESENEEESSDDDDSFSNNNEMKPRNGNKETSEEEQKPRNRGSRRGGSNRDDDLKKVKPGKNDNEDYDSDTNRRNSETGYHYVYSFTLVSLLNLLARLDH